MADISRDDVEASKAPLIDHLIELRDRLKWSAVALLAAFVLCFVVTEDYLYPFLVSPLYDIYVDIGVENPRMIYTALH